jgi:hypothetical protein
MKALQKKRALCVWEKARRRRRIGVRKIGF